MGKNKTGKYLKYAIGEIILVVIGILIALQLNTWNQERENRKQEVLLLTQLLNEYSNNLKQLNTKIESRNDILRSCLKLLNYRKLKENEINIDTVNLHISRTLTRPTFDPDLGVTNELTNSGNLYLLTNLELRNGLTSFPSFLDELDEEELVIYNLVEERYFPFLIANYQIGPIVKNFLTDASFMDKNLLNISLSERTEWPEDLLEVTSPIDLINNPDMTDYLTLMWANTDYTNAQSIGVKIKIESIVSLINEELRKKTPKG
ncbi:MAG: hypothetical protein DA407_09390 [Bacteroidetes bacterium]|nr:MAG: hypothetical protein DA407_09390 [Bacteroidota bacterium]